MAPKAPMGAAFMITAMTPKNACPRSSSSARTVRPRSPSAISANPNSTANSSTCRMSPRAKAPTTLSGMMLRMNATALSCEARAA